MVLVTGPTHVVPPFGARVVRVSTGEEMRRAVLGELMACHVLVMAAAVTDYRPLAAAGGKTKAERWNIGLRKVPNILKEASARRRRGQVLVGFAAEIGDPEAEGARKLAERKLDLLVANRLDEPGSGFGGGTNRAILMFPGGRRNRLPLMSKARLAEAILDAVTPAVVRGKARGRDYL